MNNFARNSALAFSLLTLSTVAAGDEPVGVVVDISVLFADPDEISSPAPAIPAEAHAVLQSSDQDEVVEEEFEGIVVDIPSAVIIPSSAPPPSPSTSGAPEAVLPVEVFPTDKALPVDKVVPVENVIDDALSGAGAATDAAADGAAAEKVLSADGVGVDGAAVDGEKKNILQKITDAMSPEEAIPSLDNSRFSLYLSDRVVFAQYDRSASQFNLENARANVGLLYSEERDTVFQGGLAVDTSLLETIRISFGARAYAAILGAENTDAVALGPGVEAAYLLPLKALPLELAGSLYFAPDILTFGAGDNILDWQVDVTLPIRNQLSVFGGLRFLQLDTRPNDAEVDNRVHLGIRWDFL